MKTALFAVEIVLNCNLDDVPKCYDFSSDDFINVLKPALEQWR